MDASVATGLTTQSARMAGNRIQTYADVWTTVVALLVALKLMLRPGSKKNQNWGRASKVYHLLLFPVAMSTDRPEMCQKLSLPLFCWTQTRVGQTSAGLGQSRAFLWAVDSDAEDVPGKD